MKKTKKKAKRKTKKAEKTKIDISLQRECIGKLMGSGEYRGVVILTVDKFNGRVTFAAKAVRSDYRNMSSMFNAAIVIDQIEANKEFEFT